MGESANRPPIPSGFGGREHKAERPNIMIRKRFLGFVAAAGLLACALVAGCGGSPSPTAVAKEWMGAIIAKDLQKANSLSTEKCHRLNAMMISMTDNPRDAAEIKARFSGVKFGREKIEGDIAVIEVTGPDGKADTVKLQKVDGQWKMNAEK